MSVLHDAALREIAMAGAVDPYDHAMVQPASIDLRLGTSFRVQKPHRTGLIDLANVPPADEITELIEVVPHDQPPDPPGFNDDEVFIIHPGEFILGSTMEYLTIPIDICMVIDGKSSVGRLGLAEIGRAHV